MFFTSISGIHEKIFKRLTFSNQRNLTFSGSHFEVSRVLTAIRVLPQCILPGPLKAKHNEHHTDHVAYASVETCLLTKYNGLINLSVKRASKSRSGTITGF